MLQLTTTLSARSGCREGPAALAKVRRLGALKCETGFVFLPPGLTSKQAAQTDRRRLARAAVRVRRRSGGLAVHGLGLRGVVLVTMAPVWSGFVSLLV